MHPVLHVGWPVTGSRRISARNIELPGLSLDSNAWLVAKEAPVLSVACCPETNTVVAGTELVSSQAVVAFWYVPWCVRIYSTSGIPSGLMRPCSSGDITNPMKGYSIPPNPFSTIRGKSQRRHHRGEPISDPFPLTPPTAAYLSHSFNITRPAVIFYSPAARMG